MPGRCNTSGSINGFLFVEGDLPINGFIWGKKETAFALPRVFLEVSLFQYTLKYHHVIPFQALVPVSASQRRDVTLHEERLSTEQPNSITGKVLSLTCSTWNHTELRPSFGDTNWSHIIWVAGWPGFLEDNSHFTSRMFSTKTLAGSMPRQLATSLTQCP